MLFPCFADMRFLFPAWHQSVLFSMRPKPGGKLHEILDDQGQLIADLTLETLSALFEARHADA